MKTPQEYIKNLNNKIITKAMLCDCLYSVNKRAKNFRDKAEQYHKNRYDIYNNEEKATEKKEHYYKLKEILLSAVNPDCIHCETIRRTKRMRIYDYEDEYLEYKHSGKFIHENCYYDNELKDIVEFGDIIAECEPIKKYYLFYDLGVHSFHTPIEFEDLEFYNLKIIDVGLIITNGDDINDLISMQFVKKVITLIEEENYQYID